jgi:hypothetical protein
LPPGTTVDSPAAVGAAGKIYLAVRGIGSPTSISFGVLDRSMGTFSGWTTIDGSTPSAPTLATNGNKVALVVRGSDERIYYRIYDTATQTWGTWNAVATGSTSDRVAAALIGNTLHLVVRGDDPYSHVMWYKSVDTTTNTALAWTYVPGTTPSAPILAAIEGTNTMQLVVRGEDSAIYMNKWSGAAWQGWTALPSGLTSRSPAATVYNNDMYFEVIGLDGNLWFSSMNLGTSAFSGWTMLAETTPSAPTLTH